MDSIHWNFYFCCNCWDSRERRDVDNLGDKTPHSSFLRGYLFAPAEGVTGIQGLCESLEGLTAFRPLPRFHYPTVAPCPLRRLRSA